jgi:hypothetical protein
MKFYHLLEEEIDADILGCWEKHLMGYSKVVGYSATGAIFLRNPDIKYYLVLYPSMPGNNCKKYGPFANTEEFEAKILKDDNFPSYGLYPIKPDELLVLVERLGPCEKDQVYFPVPDPSIGGSGELDTFKKGNVWIHTDIIGQNKGL